MRSLFLALCLLVGGCDSGTRQQYKIANPPVAGTPEHFLVRIDNNSQWQINLGGGVTQQGQAGLVLIQAGGHAVFDIGYLPAQVTVSGVSSYPIAYATFPPQTKTLGVDYAATDIEIEFGIGP